jgi:hypothetical protein
MQLALTMAKIRLLTLSCIVTVGLWAHPLALAQIQGGRAPDGTLWLTDGNLPRGIQAEPLALDQLMTLPGGQTTEQTGQRFKTTPSTTVTTENNDRLSAEDKLTCRGIQKRYSETKTELETVERKKAAGTLLIPDSGMTTLRQNLATLDRLRSLCD